MTTKLWTTDEVAHHLGLASTTSATSYLGKWGINPVAREPGRSGRNLYDADIIEATVATTLGRGNHNPKKETPVTSPANPINLPQYVIDYVTELAPDFRRDTMLDILDREARDHDATFLTGGRKNKVVRMCLSGTERVYACVSPSAAAFPMPASFADVSTYTYVQNMDSYPVKMRFPRGDEDAVDEFHRLADRAYRARGGHPRL